MYVNYKEKKKQK